MDLCYGGCLIRGEGLVLLEGGRWGERGKSTKDILGPWYFPSPSTLQKHVHHLHPNEGKDSQSATLVINFPSSSDSSK